MSNDAVSYHHGFATSATSATMPTEFLCVFSLSLQMAATQNSVTISVAAIARSCTHRRTTGPGEIHLRRLRGQMTRSKWSRQNGVAVMRTVSTGFRLP